MNTWPTHTRTAVAVVSTAALLGTVFLGTVFLGAVSSSAASDAAPTAPAPTTPTRTDPTPPVLPLPPPSDFVRRVDNPYSPFVPGMKWVYRGGTALERERIVIRVLHRTRTIQGITATVVRDTVRLNGELIEDTFDWYAQDRRGSVWYLGEDTREYEDGKVVSTEGSWETGVDGAQAGVIMFRRPRVGEPFWQEYYRGHAEDQAMFLTLDTRVATKSGVFKRVRMTEDTTALDPTITELKFYARGVGVVLELDLAPEAGRSELVRFRGPR